MPKTVLLTGATGFIAGHIMKQLLDAGHTVHATARSDTKAGALEELGAKAFVADLTADAGWADAARGCDAVLHTASPFPLDEPSDPDALIKPAVDGTRRVLSAAASAGVKRAVVTSSVAAVAYGQPGRDEGVFTEDDWTDPDGANVGAYVRSKTLAERAAWEIANQHSIGLSTINPVLVLGPLTDPSHGSSVGLVRQVMSGKIPAIPPIGFGVVDVRDVARAHIAAMETDAAIGERFILSESWMWFGELAQTLKSAFPDKKIATRKAPALLVKLMAPFDSQLRSVRDSLNVRRAASGQKASSVLGIDYVPASESIVTTGRSLIEHGLV